MPMYPRLNFKFQKMEMNNNHEQLLQNMYRNEVKTTLV